MRLALPVANFHPGNPSDFLKPAFEKLDVEADILDQAQFEKSFVEKTHDFYLCVDSGQPLQLLRPPFEGSDLSRIGFWFIDFRHNKENPGRKPNDWETSKFLHENGGHLFLAQKKDAEECSFKGLTRSMWLPLAADPEVWKPVDSAEKKFDLGFVGNVWDKARAQVLQALHQDPGINILIVTPSKENPGAWKEQAALALSQCRVGFNINSFYGSKYDFDLNMRLFETLSCGLPLITNDVDSIPDLFGEYPPFVKSYRGPQEIIPCIHQALLDKNFLSSGEKGRDFIIEKASYDKRAKELLSAINERLK